MLNRVYEVDKAGSTIFMFQSIAQLKLKEFAETVPAFLIIVGITLSFSIADGIGLGLMACAVLHLATGRARQLTGLNYIVALIFGLHLLRTILSSQF